MWNGVVEVVEVVGSQDCEIECRGRIWPAKTKTERRGRCFHTTYANDSGVCRVGIYNGVDVVVDVVGAVEREIGWGRGFALPNRKPSAMHSVSIGC